MEVIQDGNTLDQSGNSAEIEARDDSDHEWPKPPSRAHRFSEPYSPVASTIARIIEDHFTEFRFFVSAVAKSPPVVSGNPRQVHVDDRTNQETTMDRPVIRDRIRTLLTHGTTSVPDMRFCGKDTDDIADGEPGMHVKPIRVCPVGFDAKPVAALERCLMVAMCATAMALPGTSGAQAPGFDFFQRLKQNVVAVRVHGLGQGSGVVVDVDKVVTNCHVVADAERTALTQEILVDRWANPLEATLAVWDDDHDLCLLSIEEPTSFPMEMKASLGRFQIHDGDRVYAVGAPMGLIDSISEGIVSARRNYQDFDPDRRRHLPIEICSYSDRRSAWFIQTDAGIAPGSSGGGLFDQEGELIGIMTFGRLNLGFAVPAEFVKKLLNVEPENALHEIVKKVVEQGNLSDAISIANRIDVPNKRAKALLHIANAQIKAGYAAEAEGILVDAIRAAVQDNDLAKNTRILRSIVQSLTRIGSVTRAMQTAEHIMDPAQRSRALSHVAKEQAEEENFAGAMDTANMITLPSKRIKALDTVWEIQTKALVKEGNFTEAIRLARGVGDPAIRAHIFLRIAKAQAKARHDAREIFNDAARAANEIGSSVKRADALRDIAEARIKAGHVAGTREAFSDAISAARQITDPMKRAVSFRYLAEALSDIRDFTSAIQLAESIDDQSERAVVLRGIVKALADTGYFDRAVQLAESIDDRSERGMALREIVEALVDAGYFDRAVQLAESIDDRSESGMALHEIVKASADAENYTRALQLAERIDGHGERAGALLHIAEAVVGSTAQAVLPEILTDVTRSASQINEPRERASILKRIAKVQAEAGDYDGALDTANQIENDRYYNQALLKIIEELADVERFLQARKLIERLSRCHPRDRDEALGYIDKTGTNSD